MAQRKQWTVQEKLNIVLQGGQGHYIPKNIGSYTEEGGSTKERENVQLPG